MLRLRAVALHRAARLGAMAAPSCSGGEQLLHWGAADIFTPPSSRVANDLLAELKTRFSLLCKDNIMTGKYPLFLTHRSVDLWHYAIHTTSRAQCEVFTRQSSQGYSVLMELELPGGFPQFCGLFPSTLCLTDLKWTERFCWSRSGCAEKHRIYALDRTSGTDSNYMKIIKRNYHLRKLLWEIIS